MRHNVVPGTRYELFASARDMCACERDGINVVAQVTGKAIPETTPLCQGLRKGQNSCDAEHVGDRIVINACPQASLGVRTTPKLAADHALQKLCRASEWCAK